jgi:multidrug resistance efflux pump
MVIIIGIYAAFIWLIFFKLKVLPWNWKSKTASTVVGIAILLTFMGLLNSRTPSGRVTVMSPVVEIASAVNGTVAKVLVKTHQVVKDGDILFTLDKRPFEFAVHQAQAKYDITEVTYKRTITANKNRPDTFSLARVDETRTNFEDASAILEIAKYNLDRTETEAVGQGILGAVRVQVGDRAAAFKPVMGMMRTGEAKIWGVFQQTGNNAITIGSDVGIAFASEPGVVRWTKIAEIAPGTGSGQMPVNARLVSLDDIGISNEVLVILDWPEGMSSSTLAVGNIGAATVIGPNAGPIGSLAQILLIVKAWAQYL